MFLVRGNEGKDSGAYFKSSFLTIESPEVEPSHPERVERAIRRNKTKYIIVRCMGGSAG